jgi:hypothetical protein
MDWLAIALARHFEPMLRLRPEQTEKRRPEQHAGHNFRHHLRLAPLFSCSAGWLARLLCVWELKKKLDGEMQVVHESR